MASSDELHATIEARMEELLHEARTLEHSPRSTITPDRSRADDAGRSAIALLQQLGPGSSHASIQIRGTIGEGGMGIVRAGHQVALGREVAVKTLKDEARSEAATLKLLREAWVTGLLEHPNVVPVYDISLDAEGSPRIVLKKIAGSDWAQLMRDERAIRQKFHTRDPFEWNVRILMQVCNAVHFAHARGILHRDLKPENVMVGEFGEVYVLDWGIAVSLRDDGTGRLPLAKDATDLAGTPAYLAPEMLGGKPGMLTPRTDVYLLGAVLYEIVTGRPPHDGSSLMEILHQVLRSEPELPESTPAELVRIIRRAMDPDPDARFESAEQLRLALAGFLEHRGSLKLTAEADTRLRELDEERRTEGSDPDEKRQRLYHLFGECRFGYLEALAIWKGNEKARDGLRRAIASMIELELEQGDPKAAALLLAELEEPPAELASRVAAARERWAEEERRKERLARDHDPTVGRRTRVFLSTVLGATWTITPLARWLWERENGTDARAIVLGTVGMIAFAAGLAAWARESLSRTAINRRLVRMVGIALVAQLALFVGADAVGIEHTAARPLLMLLYATCAATTAATVEARLWPSAACFALGFVISAARPAEMLLLQSITNLVLTINVLGVWGRMSDDLVAPIKERHESRKKAWQDFLERKRLRESLPQAPDAHAPNEDGARRDG